MAKIVLLGSGELGKEFVIAAQRLGQTVIAVDSYAGAPAMQVADAFEVIDMLDGEALDGVVEKHQPDFVVPEVEAIRTERFYNYEKKEITVVPSAKAANYTMNRKAIRDLAAQEVGVKTAPYAYATSGEELMNAAKEIGFPCVVKPLMSSSGKGQSVLKSEQDALQAWEFAIDGSRGDVAEVIVEGFIDFDYEITLLTVTQNEGPTLFCPPIGHRQERGDYQESWQPHPMQKEHLNSAQMMADQVTTALGGAGIWGVEFFISEKDGVYFSELSPRPHDTGMVTMAGTQQFNEFELHLRAILGLPIDAVPSLKKGASAVVLAHDESQFEPRVSGLKEAASIPQGDFRVFGKPSTRPYRRMGVGLAYGEASEAMEEVVERAKKIAGLIKIN